MARVVAQNVWAWTDRAERLVPAGLPLLWARLRPIGRLALVGMAAATISTALFLIYLPGGLRALVEIEGRTIATESAALAPALSELGQRSALAPTEVAAVDGFMKDVLLDDRRVGAKLWTLESVLLYSNTGALVGGRFPSAMPWIQDAVVTGLAATASDLDQSGGQGEPLYDELLDLYVPIRHPTTGAPIAVMEVHEDRRVLAAQYTEIATVGLGAVWMSFSLLALSLAVFIGSTVRSVNRERVQRVARGIERTGLVEAADDLASSLELDRLFSALDERVRPLLRLSRFSLVEAGSDVGRGYAVRLRDGSYVVADRLVPPLSEDDKRVIHSCSRSLDAALSNAALYEQVRRAAIERRTLLRQVAVAHEEERRRLVGELHDALAGQLVRALFAVRQIDGRTMTEVNEASGDLARLEGIIAGSEELLRAFMDRVRPAAIDELGLTLAVEDVVVRFARESRLRVRFRVRGDPNRLDPAASLAMFRAAEEALLNVQKHAEAAFVCVTLIAGHDTVALVVQDDGRGPGDTSSSGPGRGLGLAYMRERAEAFGGLFCLVRGRLGGTRVVVRIPVAAE